jgi:hypothetical protein
MASEPFMSATDDGARPTVDRIDQELVESYTDLIRSTSIHGETYAVYFHKLGDPLQPLSYVFRLAGSPSSGQIFYGPAEDWIE